VNALAFSADGRRLISGSSDGTVKIWRIPSGKLESSFDTTLAEVRSVAVSADGHRFAAGLRYGMLKAWRFRERQGEADFKAHESDIWSLAFSPDGRVLCSANGDWGKPGHVKLWDAGTYELRQTFASRGEVLSVAISPDGRTIAAGCADGTVAAWSASTPNPHERVETNR
jgi:WD40 repeat protein